MAGSLSIAAELTYVRMRGLMPYFRQASQRYGLPLSLLLAVASRESRMGLAITETGTGDNGYGIGIMQIDLRWHPQFTSTHSAFDHQANINYGARFLRKLLNEFGGNAKAAVAAYNAGASRVRSALAAGVNPDHVTTGRDYASDVLHRKQLITDLMGISKVTSMATYALPIGLFTLATLTFIHTDDE